MSILTELLFSDKNYAERLARVPEDVWGDLKRETALAVKMLLETNMDVQVQDLIGARHWEHNNMRPTYRNGHYIRKNIITFGGMINVKVPRVRTSGLLKFKILDKYQRRAREVDNLIINMFLNGVSTRRVAEVLEPLYGPRSVSAGLVSKITKALDSQVQKFHRRSISDKYQYLILDGIYLNAKIPTHKRRRCILAAYGIWLDENNNLKRELIDFQMASKGESGNAWWRFLNGLYNRGLEGRNLKLITTDGNEGLHNAIELIYPEVLPQLCWAHKLRNVADKLPRRLQGACISEASRIYNAQSYWEALGIYRRWVKSWRLAAPKAVKCMENDIEELLNFYRCDAPKELWIKIRTTNAIERCFREVRRRTRPMSCFQNTASVERIIYAVFYRLNKKWGTNSDNMENALFYKITHTC
jgi:transposase-like protein